MDNVKKRIALPVKFFLFVSQGSMESVHATEPQTEILSVSATKLGEPIQQAIPLLPPFQPSEGRPHYPGWRDIHSSHSQSAALAESQGVTISTVSKGLKT